MPLTKQDAIEHARKDLAKRLDIDDSEIHESKTPTFLIWR